MRLIPLKIRTELLFFHSKRFFFFCPFVFFSTRPSNSQKSYKNRNRWNRRCKLSIVPAALYPTDCHLIDVFWKIVTVSETKSDSHYSRVNDNGPSPSDSITFFYSGIALAFLKNSEKKKCPASLDRSFKNLSLRLNSSSKNACIRYTNR